MIIDIDTLIARNQPVASVTKHQWNALPKLGYADDRYQAFVHHTVRRYDGKRVVMLSGEYGREPYQLFDIDAKGTTN